MKRFIRLFYTITIGILLFLAFGYHASIDASDTSYYSSISTSDTGNDLLTDLHDLIDADSVTVLKYDDLWEAYTTTDTKLGTNLLWDIYSSTNYVSMDPNTKGANISGEGVSYNREHAVCQSFFDSAYPMVSDIHHIYPVDGLTNTMRNDNLYGEVEDGTETYTSSNNARVGSSTTSISVTVSGKTYTYDDNVFEINDQYKGDIARTYFYVATRYYDLLGTWITNESNAKYIFTDSYPYLTSYAYTLFMNWNYEDPVSEKETLRNEACYSIQGNRNPYIDDPSYVASVFEGAASTYGYTGSFTYATLTVNDTKVSNVETLIDAIPTDPEYSDRDTVFQASNAYLLLNDEEKKAVDSTKYETMVAAVKIVANLIEPDPGTVTYTVTSKTSVSVSGTAPDGSSATIENTSAGTDKYQITAKNTMTLTLSGYAGKIISGIGFFMKSNKNNGAGYISITAKSDTLSDTLYSLGSTSGVAYSDSSFNGSYSGSYSYVIKTFTSYTVSEKMTLTILIGGTVNSLYCQKISIIYEDQPDASTEQFEKLSTKSSMRFHYSESDGESDYYELCTDVSEITAGTEFVIATLSGTLGMGSIQSTNNRFSPVDISVSNNRISDASELTLITVEEGNSSGSFALKTAGGYLGNAAASTNQLRCYSTKTDDKYAWTITISDTGEAVIKIVSTGITSNTISYNSASNAQYFACYSSVKTSLAIYIKKTGNTSSYSYSDVKLQFGGCLSKELYEALIKEGTEVSFGVSLSLDGTSYTDYECNPVYVTAFGDADVNPDGSYVQYFIIIPVPESDYGSLVYAKCYAEIDGTKYYMSETSYSIKTLASYYVTNSNALNLSDSQISAVKGLVA